MVHVVDGLSPPQFHMPPQTTEKGKLSAAFSQVPLQSGFQIRISIHSPVRLEFKVDLRCGRSSTSGVHLAGVDSSTQGAVRGPAIVAAVPPAHPFFFG